MGIFFLCGVRVEVPRLTGGPVTRVTPVPPVTQGDRLSYVLELELSGAILYAYDRDIDFTPAQLRFAADAAFACARQAQLKPGTLGGRGHGAQSRFR
jgi:hypothetical protein